VLALEGPGDIDKTVPSVGFVNTIVEPAADPAAAENVPKAVAATSVLFPSKLVLYTTKSGCLGATTLPHSPLTPQTKILRDTFPGLLSRSAHVHAPVAVHDSARRASTARLRGHPLSPLSPRIAEPTVAHNDGSTKIGSVRTRSPEWKRSSGRWLQSVDV